MALNSTTAARWAEVVAGATEGLWSVNEFPTRSQALMEILTAMKLRHAAASRIAIRLWPASRRDFERHAFETLQPFS
jgi:hypothetical protein